MRQNVDDSNPHEIIPISFNLRRVLQDKYFNLEGENEKYMIQTRSQMKASGAQLPEVHGSRKGLDPHEILKKQPQPMVRLSIEKNSRLGQGRAGMRRKVKLVLPSQNTGSGSSESKPIFINGEAVSAVDPILSKPILEFLEVRYNHHIFFYKQTSSKTP